jgi:RES domain-containing protein
VETEAGGFAAKTDALYTVGTEPVKGKFFRYIRTRYANEPLSTFGSMHSGGRYNVAGLFAVLYLGADEETCQAEVSQGIAAGVEFKQGAFTAWEYDVELKAVVRIDKKAIQRELDISEDEITIPGNHWTASGIGEHLHKRSDVEGLMAPSAHFERGRCLDVFLDKVTTPQHVTPQANLGTWPR